MGGVRAIWKPSWALLDRRKSEKPSQALPEKALRGLPVPFPPARLGPVESGAESQTGALAPETSSQNRLPEPPREALQSGRKPRFRFRCVRRAKHPGA